MKTLAKIAAAIVAFFVLAFVAAAVILPHVINPNDFKPQIERLVHQRTGRQLKIPGKISLSVFPWLGFDIGQASLSNPPGFGQQPFASINQAKVRLKLLPLLHEQVHIGTVSLEGLALHLVRNASGRTNWSDLSGNHGGNAGASPKPTQKRHKGGFSLRSLQVASLEVNDAELTWDNEQQGKRYKLSDIHLRTGGLRTGATFPVDLGFQLTASKPQVKADVHLTGQVLADLGNKRYKMNNLSVNVQASGKGVPGDSQKLTFSGDATADLKSQTASLSNLQLAVAGVKATANMQVHPIMGHTAFTGSFSVPSFNPRTVMSQLGMSAPDTRDDKALTQVSMSSDFSGTPHSVSLHGMKIKLDGSNLTGRVSVDGFSDPAVRFNMALDQMNVDQYLPRSSQSGKDAGSQSGQGGGAASGGGINAVRVPVKKLKPLNVDGVLKADSLQLMHLHLNNARLAVKADNGKLTIRPLSAKLYQGTMHLTSTVNASGKRPTYAVVAHLDDLHFSPLLQDLLGKQVLAGTGSLSVDLTSAGQTVGDIRHALNGKLSLHLANGAVYGFNLSQLIADARARLQGKSAPSAEAAKTRFSEFNFLATIADGMLRSRDLAAHNRWLDVHGSGHANLVTNQLDYTALAKLTEVPSALSGHNLDMLKGIDIPVRFNGNITSPKIRVDLASALSHAAGSQLQKESQSLQQQGQKNLRKQKQKLEEKARNKLKQFFGQ